MVAVSNLLGIIIALVSIIVGFVLLLLWWSMFTVVLKGIVPILLLLLGAGTLIFFISEIKSKLSLEKEKPSSPPEEKKV